MLVNWRIKPGDRFLNTCTGEEMTVRSVDGHHIRWDEDGYSSSTMRFDMSWLEPIERTHQPRYRPEFMEELRQSIRDRDVFELLAETTTTVHDCLLAATADSDAYSQAILKWEETSHAYGCEEYDRADPCPRCTAADALVTLAKADR